MDTCIICMAESFHSSPETTTPSLISYTLIEDKSLMFEKKKSEFPRLLFCRVLKYERRKWASCVRAKSLQSRLTASDPRDCSPLGSSVHEDSPGKNTGVDCHAFLQKWASYFGAIGWKFRKKTLE